MPTAKPRITITLTDEQHLLLQTLSDLQGQSMSSIVVELLDTVVPVLERVAVVLKAAKDAPESVRKELKRSAESAEADFLPIAHQMMGQLDLLVAVGAGDSAAQRADPVPTASAKKPRPPPSNRGVSSPSKSNDKSSAKPRQARVSAKSVGGKK